jgi:hypothetical protein
VRRQGSHIFKTLDPQMAVRFYLTRRPRFPRPQGEALVLISVRAPYFRNVLCSECQTVVIEAGTQHCLSYSPKSSIELMEMSEGCRIYLFQSVYHFYTCRLKRQALMVAKAGSGRSGVSQTDMKSVSHLRRQ